MMKLSHESKLRLGIGIGAFALIIGLVFGTSRLLAHSDMVRTTGILSGHLSDFDDMFDDDDLLDDGSYSARPQQLSSMTFDADEFRYLDFDINAASVDVKVVDGNKARVSSGGALPRVWMPPRSRRKTSHPSRTRRSRFSSLEVMTVRQSIARLRLSCRAVLPNI